MEVPDMPVADVPEGEPVPNLEDQKMDRIAFELWQQGSLPEVPEAPQTEIEEVAHHSSCL